MSTPCVRCGTVMEAGDLFCSSCGASVPPPPLTAPAPPPPPGIPPLVPASAGSPPPPGIPPLVAASAGSPPPPSSGNSRKVTAIAAAVTVIVAAIVAVALVMARSGGDDEKSASTADSGATVQSEPGDGSSPEASSDVTSDSNGTGGPAHQRPTEVGTVPPSTTAAPGETVSPEVTLSPTVFGDPIGGWPIAVIPQPTPADAVASTQLQLNGATIATSTADQPLVWPAPEVGSWSLDVRALDAGGNVIAIATLPITVAPFPGQYIRIEQVPAGTSRDVISAMDTAQRLENAYANLDSATVGAIDSRGTPPDIFATCDGYLDLNVGELYLMGSTLTGRAVELRFGLVAEQEECHPSPQTTAYCLKWNVDLDTGQVTQMADASFPSKQVFEGWPADSSASATWAQSTCGSIA